MSLRLPRSFKQRRVRFVMGEEKRPMEEKKEEKKEGKHREEKDSKVDGPDRPGFMRLPDGRRIRLRVDDVKEEKKEGKHREEKDSKVDGPDRPGFMRLPDGRRIRLRVDEPDDIKSLEGDRKVDLGWAYISGFLDADGSITLHKGSAKKAGAHRIESSQGVVLIAQRIRWPLDLIRRAVGYGSIVVKKNSLGNNVYEWRVTKENEVIDFLINYLPHGINKQKQGVLLAKYYLKRHEKAREVQNLRRQLRAAVGTANKNRVKAQIRKVQLGFERWMNSVFFMMQELKKELD